MRLNTEKKIECEKFKLKVGTTNKNKPIVIYFEGRTFICPMVEKDSYVKDFNEIKRKLKLTISDRLSKSERFDDKFILDFQVASNGVMVNKRSFLYFQFLLRQNPKNELLPFTKVKNDATDFIGDIIPSLEKIISDYHFTLNKTKK